MTLLRVQLQAASRYPLGQMLRMVRGHPDVGFSVVEVHVDPAYLFEAERPRSYLAQFVIDPARRWQITAWKALSCFAPGQVTVRS